MEIPALSQWVGRTESSTDTVTAAPVAALSATLDRDDPQPRPGDPLPLTWHWLYFLPLHKPSELGADGHARLGDFLPPVPLPRRMYAGGSIDARHPLRVGDPIGRVSRIVDVVQKEGRSGPLVFVKVRHEISNHAGVALIEDHDIVYRGAGSSFDTLRMSGDVKDAEWTREIVPDEVLLFRYSALTFNGYRIHYDRQFATTVQRYPGLVVHAPLIATLLADLLRRNLPGANVATFSFRALRPLFDGVPFTVCGRPADDGLSAALWASDPDGAVAFEAAATLV